MWCCAPSSGAQTVRAPKRIMILAPRVRLTMTGSDVSPHVGTPAASPFVGAPFSFLPAIIAGMAIGAVVLWIVATVRTVAAPDPLMAHLVPWARGMARSDERDQFLYHAGIVLTGLGGVAGAWLYARITRRLAAGAPHAATLLDARGGVQEQRTTCADVPARWMRVLLHALVVVAVASLLYVPDYRALAGSFLTAERFHHWHVYALMPTYAYLTGSVPVLESYSQYGVGIPVVIGNLCRLIGDFSHASVVWLGMTYGVVYFVALYALLCAWLQDWRWSVAGLALCILLQQFCGLDPPSVLWQYPSATILRSPLDVWVFLLLTAHVYRATQTSLVLAGVIVGAAVFWESDTGLYLAAAYLAYCTYCWIDDLTTRGWGWHRTIAYLAPATVVPIVFLFLTWRSVGGAVFTAVFWTRFTEPMRLFRSGFGMLPMPALRWGTLHFFLAPALYILAGALALVAASHLSRRPWRGGYLIGALGVYGLGTYHQYVGRSHPWNWFHVCIPFVVLAVVLGRLALQTLGARLQARGQPESTVHFLVRATELAPVVLLGTAIVVLLAAPTVRCYPGILSARWFIPGVEWNFPGVGLRTLDSQRRRDRLGAVAARIRQSVPANEPVAIVSEFDSILYIMTNRRPFSRLVPLYPAVMLDSHVDEVVGALHNRSLRYVFVDRGPAYPPRGSYLPRLLSQHVAADFELVDQVERFEVWRRRETAPAS